MGLKAGALGTDGERDRLGQGAMRQAGRQSPRPRSRPSLISHVEPWHLAGARLRRRHAAGLPLQAPRRQRGAAGRRAPSAAHRPRTSSPSKWFAIGMAVATSAWLFHVAALAFAPLSVVQAVLSTGVVILAVMAERLFGFKVGARQWIGVGMTAGGLFLLVVTLPATSGAHSSYSLAGMIAFESAMLVIGALLISRPAHRRPGPPPRRHARRRGRRPVRRLRRRHQGAHRRLGDGFLAILLSPWLFVAILGSIIAFYASARGLQDGEAVPVIASTSTAANVSCIARRHHRLRRPDARRRARHRRPDLRLHDGRRRRPRHAAARPRRRGERLDRGQPQPLGGRARVTARAAPRACA